MGRQKNESEVSGGEGRGENGRKGRDGMERGQKEKKAQIRSLLLLQSEIMDRPVYSARIWLRCKLLRLSATGTPVKVSELSNIGYVTVISYQRTK